MPAKTRSDPDPPAGESATLNAVERTDRAIVGLIETGRLIGGSALVELELAERLHVARSTVREALARLESRGFAVRARGRGLVLRRLDRTDVADLYLLREHLEGLAARLAAERQGRSRMLPAARIAEERKRWNAVLRSRTHAAFSEANRAFHRLVLDASGNRHLPDMLDRTLMTLLASQFRAWIAPPDALVAARQHLDILAAIEAGDAAAAERAMRTHVRDAGRLILKLDDRLFE